jgi:hypothetical protein
MRSIREDQAEMLKGLIGTWVDTRAAGALSEAALRKAQEAAIAAHAEETRATVDLRKAWPKGVSQVLISDTGAAVVFFENTGGFALVEAAEIVRV